MQYIAFYMFNMLRKNLIMKFIKSMILFSIFFSTNLFCSSDKKVHYYIEFPKGAQESGQWRNHYGDAVIAATSDEKFIYPINCNDYAQWGGRLEAQDFILLWQYDARKAQKFETKDEYKQFLLEYCGDHKEVVKAHNRDCKVYYGLWFAPGYSRAQSKFITDDSYDNSDC